MDAILLSLSRKVMYEMWFQRYGLKMIWNNVALCIAFGLFVWIADTILRFNDVRVKYKNKIWFYRFIFGYMSPQIDSKLYIVTFIGFAKHINDESLSPNPLVSLVFENICMYLFIRIYQANTAEHPLFQIVSYSERSFDLLCHVFH